MTRPNVVTAYIGLGGNLGDPPRQMHAALGSLHKLVGIEVVQVSSLYRSAPVGYDDQDDFFNAVAELSTDAAPVDLLDHLLGIENVVGRVRNGPRFGPRVVDLDLLLYGDAVIDLPRLTVPHPRMIERRFVLEPLAEIAPDIVVPGQGPVAESLLNVKAQDVERLPRLSSNDDSSLPAVQWPGLGPAEP